MTARVSRCLSAAGLCFLGILSRPGLPPLSRSAYRARQQAARTPTGLPRSARMRCGWGRGRVRTAHCCAALPSEPGMRGFPAPRLKQAQRFTGRQKCHFHWSVPTGVGSRNSCV